MQKLFNIFYIPNIIFYFRKCSQFIVDVIRQIEMTQTYELNLKIAKNQDQTFF